MSKITSIGGQALIEGIMMKGPKKTSISVRLPDNTIDTDFIDERHLKDKHKFFGLPIIRGCVNLVESMIQGYKALMISADKSGYADMEDEKKPEATEKEGKDKKTSTLITVIGIIGGVLGVVLGLFLFTYIPSWLFDDVLSKNIPADISVWKTLFEGVIKIIVFVLYIAAVSLMKDIRRVFMYHGAEHKSIFCYESGEELTVENIKKQIRFHPRCGTSFIILMLIVSILVSSLIIMIFPVFRESSMRLYWVIIKILLIPLICGIGYELIKICGRHNNIVTRIIAAPGLWLQRLTTKEPDDSMIEVAIAALTAVIPENSEDDRW